MAINAKKLLPSADPVDFIAVPKKIALPVAKIIPSSKNDKGILGVVNLVKGEPEEDGGGINDKAKEDIGEIGATTKKIHKIIQKTVKINLEKIKNQNRIKENKKRKEKESKLEKKSSIGGGISIPTNGPVGNLLSFMNKLIGAIILIKLIDLLPAIADIVSKLQIGKVFDFLVDFSIGMFDKLVSFIDIGYKVVNKVNVLTENIFGKDAADKLKSFEGLFVKFMNLAIIAAMISTGGSNPLGGGKGGNRTNSRGRFNRNGIRTDTVNGFNRRVSRNGTLLTNSGTNLNNQRMIRGGSTSNAAAARSQQDLAGRYQQRFGKRAAKNRFGQAFGKVGKKVASRGAGRIAGKIPIVGPLIDFGIRTLVFKEPVGKAAAAAVGAAAGQALGTFLGGAIGGIVGSVVPFIGNILLGAAGSTIGGLIGGVIGDQIGASLYNVLTGSEKNEAKNTIEGRYGGGQIGEDEDSNADKNAALSAKIKNFTPSGIDNLSGANKTKTENIFGSVDDKDGAFALIKKSTDKLRERNNSIVSKIMSLGVALLTGKKVDRRIVADIAKNLVTFFDAALPAPMNMLRILLQKLSAGGTVVELPNQKTRRLFEVSKKIENSFLRDVTQNTQKVTNDLDKTSTLLSTRPKRVAPGAGAPTTTAPTTTAPRTGAGTPTPAGITLPGSSKLMPLKGNTGSAIDKIFGQGSNVNTSYSPFATGSGAEITSSMGMRDLGSGPRLHKGVDVGAPTGTRMYAYLDGEVTHVNNVLGSSIDGGYGYWIVWKDDVHGAYHFFGHLNGPPAGKVGDKFKAGALLANVGGSGWGSLTTYDPHLHWEISKSAPASNGDFSSPVNPIDWINNHGKVKRVSYIPTQNSQQPQTLMRNTNYEEGSGSTLLLVDREVRVPVPVVIRTVNRGGGSPSKRREVLV